MQRLSSLAVNSPRPPPRLPLWGRRRTSQAGWLPAISSFPSPPNSLVLPTWANVVRGDVWACVEGPVCPTPQPEVSSADFSAFYERCLASGLKARVVFGHAAGLLVVTVTCSLPTTSMIAATANKRRNHRRRRRGRAATTVGASTVCSPSTATTAPAGKSATTPTLEAVSSTPPSTHQPVPSPSSPEVITPPPKGTRRRCKEVELLRGPEEEGELLFSPLFGVVSPLPFSLLSPSIHHTPSTASPPLLPPAPLDLEPVSPVLGPPARPTFPASPPPVVAPSAGSVPAGQPSLSPLPPPLPSP
jgi:hypothetical protein